MKTLIWEELNWGLYQFWNKQLQIVISMLILDSLEHPILKCN